MKRMRTAFLSLGLALLAGVLFSDSAAAQCMGCGVAWDFDGETVTVWTHCIHGLESGVDSCSTPEPTKCEMGDSCSTELAVMLDGRAAPRQFPEYPAGEALVDASALTAFSAA